MAVARVAALYDIHAHLPALRAVLDEVDAEGIETLVIGGDVAAGPLPSDGTVARALSLELGQLPLSCRATPTASRS